MELLLFIFAAVIPVDGFTVRGPSAPLSAPLGSSVVLPCYVDEALPVEDLEVEWRRADSETLIHLYQDGESRAEVQQQDYHDRAHFFTEEIQHGNFSLRLDNLTAQDEGEYRCRVHSQQDSGETVAQIKDVERLLVSGSDESISAYAGEDVTLNCSVDSHITPEYIEEVSWKKTDKDGDFPVLLYQNNETVSEATHDKFRGRVEFFTAEIPKGNFSLRLKSVRTEDKGVYMCQVFAGDLSASVTVVLKRLGFSVLHIIMMILCVSASGSALLLCFMIYCRSTTKGIIQPFVSLGSSVVLPCYVDKPVKHLKVEWKRADLDSDSETLVHLYQDGESRAEVQQQDYHDRAHFFTEEIQHGNFSLRLDNLGTEDAGEYRCRVHSQHNHVFSTKVILELEYDHSSSLAGFMVKTPSGPLVIPLGSSVILPCYCNKDLADLRVEWRRSDSETLVHLYQDGESQPEEQDEDEQNRAHFFTEQIQHGNFSLRLNNLTAEDKGEYTCTVYSQQNAVFSTKTNLEVGILDAYFHLQMFLVICPNMIMSCAFALWGISEGSLNESVSCCALYFLRPLLLLWAAPFISNFTGNIKTLILKYSYVAEYVSLSIVIYTALFATAFEKLVNYAEFEKHMIIVLFAVVFLCCLCKIVYTFIIVVILPLLMMMTNDTWFFRCYDRLNCSESIMRTVMLIFILLINAAMIGLYILTLENKTDAIGWACVMLFLQILWAIMKFTVYFLDFDNVFHRVVAVYVFGSVGIVLLNSVTLMTELILKTVNGDRMLEDLRFIVFPSECVFAISLLISGLFPSSVVKCLQFFQKRVKSKDTQKQNTTGSQELTNLNAEYQDEDLLDSKKTQKNQ
ncbi:uncharacterized protein isoform X5 [Danio rerio]|uniref:Uncharacterized protein isoform X5 n=1 Tax=Danio rerio TaxID=7955 RepID=A0AC58J178_DANRE